MEKDETSPDAAVAFGSDPTFAAILRSGSALLGPQVDSWVLEDLFWMPKGDFWNGQFDPLSTGLPNLPLPSGTPDAPSWSGDTIDWEGLLPPPEPAPEPEEPELTPLSVMIYHPPLGGWITLGHHPAVDRSQPIALVVDHPRFGYMTLGWIMPDGVMDPDAARELLPYGTGPLSDNMALDEPPEFRAFGDQSDDIGGADGEADDRDGFHDASASWSGAGDGSPDGANPADVGTHAYDLAMSRRRAEAVEAVKAGRRISGVAPAQAEEVRRAQDTVPPSIDPAGLPPGPLSPADYERVATRNRYLAGLYDPESLADRALDLVTGAMSRPANILTPAERAEHQALSAKLFETIFPKPTPQEARLDTMLGSPWGTAASVLVGALGGGQETQDAALGAGAVIDNIGAAVAGIPRGPTVSRPIRGSSPTMLVSPVAEPGKSAPERFDNLSRGVTRSEPGAWQARNESMSERARAYQTQVTGRTGQSYVVGDVSFDGFAGGVLLEAKGPGYDSFVRNGEFLSFFRGADALVNQAINQLEAANGMPIVWHVAEPQAALAIKELFNNAQIQGISIIYDPVKN